MSSKSATIALLLAGGVAIGMIGVSWRSVQDARLDRDNLAAELTFTRAALDVASRERSALASKQEFLSSQLAAKDGAIAAKEKAAAEQKAVTDKLWAQYQKLADDAYALRVGRTEAIAKLKALYPYRWHYPKDLENAGVSIDARNNPFFDALTEIRGIKSRSESVEQLWSELTPIAASFQQFGDRRDLAIGAMLIVAAFYDFGNPSPNGAKPGCVSISQDTGFKNIGELTFHAMTKSTIGCCTDYAIMLASFLEFLSFDVRPVINKAHQAVMVSIDGRAHILDANNLLFGQDFFAGNDRAFFYYTPYAGTRTGASQHYTLTSMAFGLEGFGADGFSSRTVETHLKQFNAMQMKSGKSADRTSSTLR